MSWEEYKDAVVQGRSGASACALRPLRRRHLGNYKGKCAGLPRLPAQILPGAQPLLGLLREIAQRRGKTMSQVAINWCICQVGGLLAEIKAFFWSGSVRLAAALHYITLEALASMESARLMDFADGVKSQSLFRTRFRTAGRPCLGLPAARAASPRPAPTDCPGTAGRGGASVRLDTGTGTHPALTPARCHGAPHPGQFQAHR